VGAGLAVVVMAAIVGYQVKFTGYAYGVIIPLPAPARRRSELVVRGASAAHRFRANVRKCCFSSTSISPRIPAVPNFF